MAHGFQRNSCGDMITYPGMMPTNVLLLCKHYSSRERVQDKPFLFVFSSSHVVGNQALCLRDIAAGANSPLPGTPPGSQGAVLSSRAPLLESAPPALRYKDAVALLVKLPVHNSHNFSWNKDKSLLLLLLSKSKRLLLYLVKQWVFVTRVAGWVACAESQ